MAQPSPEKSEVKGVPRTLESGTPVGAYVIEDMLSSGGFGVVYRARGPDQRQVAIKVSKHSARNITAQQLIWQQNEIEALTRLRHPALVEVLGYGFLEDGRLYLVMELVEGVVLGHYLQERGALEVLEALQLTRRIAEALAYCHESKVLHLDLKPANIIITDPVEPKVKVLDFGLARLSGGFRTHEGGPMAGTLAYMAPECFFGTGEFSEKADLFSLGTLLYEMLSCTLPFPNNASYAALGSLKRAGKMTPLEQVAPLVPPPVAALVRSLLDPDVSHRFGGASQLASRLKGLYFDLLDGNTSEWVPPPLPPEMVSSDAVPFVGRAREVALLREAVESVGDRQGRALMVVGEAGIGKSRLISQVLLSPEVSARVLVAYGRCRQLGELVPCSPLREALGQLVEVLLGIRSEPGHRVRHLAGLALAGEAQELRRLVPELSRLLPEGAERDTEGVLVQGLGPERVGKALMHLLTAIGNARSMVLVLEDVHSADEGTLAVLSRIIAAPAVRRAAADHHPAAAAPGRSRRAGDAHPGPAQLPGERPAVGAAGRRRQPRRGEGPGPGRAVPGQRQPAGRRADHSRPAAGELSLPGGGWTGPVVRQVERGVPAAGLGLHRGGPRAGAAGRARPEGAAGGRAL